MSQAPDPNRLGRTIVDIYNDEGERSRLLGRFAISFGTIAAAGSCTLLGLNLLGALPGQRLAFVVMLSLLLALSITLATLGLLRGRRYRLATNLFLYSAVFYVTVAIYLVGGVASPIFVLYFVPIMAAGLFGRTQDSIRLFLVALLCYIGLAILQSTELLLPVIDLHGTGRVIITLLTFGSIGGLLAYLALVWASSTSHFISQAGAQAEALFDTNQKLLEKNIQQIELGSELSTAAAELLAASHQQASGATEQASAVSQVSTTIEELGSTARQIAIAAEQVAEASRQTLENLSEGQDAVDNSIQAMERIRGRMQDVSSRVLNLGERSQQIGEIIDLINDLSDETHLLALNAAIEAAGAGEHGRRFAVVAAEVKSLANRALAAAKEVKGVIAEIQQATNSAVLAAEEGGKEVEHGVELAHSAGEVMNAIVLVAERTAQSSAEISLATAQQQSASEQVVETMREIADVARQTAAGSRQMADSAQMLTAIAERLHGLVYDEAHTPAFKAEMDALDRRMSSIAGRSNSRP
ncbi:MAG TPA: methyl-accepting chemotaxis protein [Kouleothrix sp.]|uniref:methyl-accepting chemotaxis protein n=1 Tax=Kouleothrix sp. TaxID=2779161 RepID=UPI002D122792|nr:methyl-accepting chemotaxis protein [Kouleothrix sp.]HRC77078.1 methyl-accepting chemotaxis protein [Kouleothrix sp.]